MGHPKGDDVPRLQPGLDGQKRILLYPSAGTKPSLLGAFYRDEAHRLPHPGEDGDLPHLAGVGPQGAFLPGDKAPLLPQAEMERPLLVTFGSNGLQGRFPDPGLLQPGGTRVVQTGLLFPQPALRRQTFLRHFRSLLFSWLIHLYARAGRNRLAKAGFFLYDSLDEG